MPDESRFASLAEFIALNIDSIEQILILQLLSENPQRSWTINQLTTELRSADSSIERRLEEFYRKGVLAPPPDPSVHRFVPTNEEMKRHVEDLLRAFRDSPSRVVTLVYSHPPQAIQAFAQSFKFRKEDK